MWTDTCVDVISMTTTTTTTTTSVAIQALATGFTGRLFFFVLTSLVLVCGRTLMLHTLREQRGDAASAGYGRTGGMGSSRCKCSWPRMNTAPPHGDSAGPGAESGNEQYLTAKFWNIPPQAAGARYFAVDAGEDVGEAPAAGRPAPLLEVRPQERVQRRTAEQIVDPVPVVPMLFMVEPQMVEQLVDIYSRLDLRVAEQVIEVPKIMCPPHAARTVLRAPQTAEQLVEVPTIISYSSLLLQTMDRTLPFQFVVVEGETSIFKVFSLDRIQQRRFCLWNAFLSRLWSRPWTFLFPLEAFQIFAQEGVHPQLRTHQLLGSTLRMSRFNRFFELFPGEKKVQLTPGTWVRECTSTSTHPRRLLMARVLGWTTTRVRFGRCSRIRRSARGGTARARTAPSGIRRGSAELGCCWWWWTSLCSCRDVVLLAVLGLG